MKKCIQRNTTADSSLSLYVQNMNITQLPLSTNNDINIKKVLILKPKQQIFHFGTLTSRRFRCSKDNLNYYIQE